MSEIITALERHGHHARDRDHADQAIDMITDLVGVYDGTRDVPVSTGRHAASARNPEPSGSDTFVLIGTDLSAAFAALDLAAEYKRDLIETCPDCADRSCEACQTRVHDAEAFDRLAGRILQRRLAARPADHSQPEPGGPVGPPGRADAPGTPSPHTPTPPPHDHRREWPHECLRAIGHQTEPRVASAGRRQQDRPAAVPGNEPVVGFLWDLGPGKGSSRH